MLEKHHYSAGFELLDALGQHQERAYQRLFEWVKKECSASAEMNADDVDITLQMAVKCLQCQPYVLCPVRGSHSKQQEDPAGAKVRLCLNSRRAAQARSFVQSIF